MPSRAEAFRDRGRASWRFGGGGFVSVLAAVMASISLLKLLGDIWRLPLSALVANVIKTYAVVFYTAFDVLFFWLPFDVPVVAKDVFILYSLLGSTICAAELAVVRADLAHPWLILHVYKNWRAWFWTLAAGRLAWAVLAWPIWLWGHRKSPHLAYPRGSHGPARACFLHQIGPAESYSYVCDIRLVMLMRLGCILVSAAVILAYNYAFSI